MPHSISDFIWLVQSFQSSRLELQKLLVFPPHSKYQKTVGGVFEAVRYRSCGPRPFRQAIHFKALIDSIPD